jgi:hypothetical protein
MSKNRRVPGVPGVELEKLSGGSPIPEVHFTQAFFDIPKQWVTCHTGTVNLCEKKIGP